MSEKPTKSQTRKWVSALRSGEYSQARTCLQRYNSYCCLGVACKVFIPENKLQYDALLGELDGLSPFDQLHAPQWLKKVNDNFEDIAGMALSGLNDQDMLTFDEIADCLEAVYLLEVL